MKILYSYMGELYPHESSCGDGNGRNGYGFPDTGSDEYRALGHGSGDSGHGYGESITGAECGIGCGAGSAFPFDGIWGVPSILGVSGGR